MAESHTVVMHVNLADIVSGIVGAALATIFMLVFVHPGPTSRSSILNYNVQC